MEIVWYGLSCFRMTERGKASVVTDPYGTGIGLPAIKLRADVVTVSHEAVGHNNINAVRGYRKIIDGPGEYEIGGVFITGIEMGGKEEKQGKRCSNLYVFEYDGLSVAHLGDLSYVPSQAQIEDLGAVDIALIPVGGGNALSPAEAAEVISLIEPSLVIPMHYKTGKLKLDLGPVSGFLSEMGVSKPETQPSLKINKSGLSDETQVLVLEATIMAKS